MIFKHGFMMKKAFKTKVFALICGIGACTPMIDSHGDSPDPEKLALLKLGETPYTQVQALLGTPSSRTVFDKEYWLYISSVQERTAFFRPQETSRRITVLKFDANGILQEIEEKDMTDGISVSVSEEQTKTSGHSVSLIEQFIGNIGRFEQKKRGP